MDDLTATYVRIVKQLEHPQNTIKGQVLDDSFFAYHEQHLIDSQAYCSCRPEQTAQAGFRELQAPMLGTYQGIDLLCGRVPVYLSQSPNRSCIEGIVVLCAENFRQEEETRIMHGYTNALLTEDGTISAVQMTDSDSYLFVFAWRPNTIFQAGMSTYPRTNREIEAVVKSSFDLGAMSRKDYALKAVPPIVMLLANAIHKEEVGLEAPISIN